MHALVLLALLASSATSPGDGRLEALPADGGIRVHVAKRGLFSGLAHDHDFEVTRWHGSARIPGGDLGRASLELILEADSLRDREEGLSGDDRRKVDAQAAGPGVLDAARQPEITYRSDRITIEGAGPQPGPALGTIHGWLGLRGRTLPVDATFEAEHDARTWRVRGRARFRQSQFGIQPFSGFGGTVGVKDEVEVTFALTLQAGAPAGAGAAGDAGGDARGPR